MIEQIKKWFMKPEKKEVPYRVHFRLEGTEYEDVESWDADRQRQFFVECRELLKNSALKLIIDNELQDIANHAFQQSTAESFFYDRFEAKGVARIRERLEEYSLRIEEEQGFDKHDYIPN